MKEYFESIESYCQITGKSFSFEDMLNEKGCHKTKKYYYCNCHQAKLVQEYPFQITEPMSNKSGKTKTENRVVK